MKKIIIPIFIFLLFSCQSNQKSNRQIATDSSQLKTAQVAVQDSSACSWLKTSVESFFKNEDPDGMAKITTPTYNEFKMDAMNVDLEIDGALTEAAFNKKWGGQFDLKLAGVGSGFLISGQDWGSINLSSCDVLEEQDNQITLNVVISDCEYQIDYHRVITLIKDNNSYKISNVKEFD